MIIKGLIDEDTINYKKVCMTIEFPTCSFKCDKECGLPVCQNGALANSPDISISIDEIVRRYINNPMSEAIVYQGLEPFDSWDDLIKLTTKLRQYTNDDIVIYTGYTEEESVFWAMSLKGLFKNIIIKYGRFIPNCKLHYDPVLGINLASDNQYGVRIS